MLIIEEGDCVYLEITLPEGIDKVKTELVTSEKLGMTRISEARFEMPDGSPLSLNVGLAGEKRGKNPLPGPLEGLRKGKNRVMVWRKRT